MCRIAGILNAALPIDGIQVLVKKMCELQKHGGPDDEGIFTSSTYPLVLGHKRLALIDLSETGHQPMLYNNRYSITYNGEVYNYAELKKELMAAGYLFSGNSDTEVILAAYSKWGVQSFCRFKGMFAFALWDELTNDLLLVRDAAGIKPLYYAIDKDEVSFASEIKAFSCTLQNRYANALWPVYLMAYGYLPEPVTTLKNVQPLPKGCFIKYNASSKKWNLQSYKHYSFSNKITSAQQAQEAIEKTLQQAVKNHLISDAPIGVFVSGGIDSGILAVLAAEQKKEKLHSLSLYFKEKEFSEKPFQDVLLQHLHCTPHQYLLQEKEFELHLPHVISAMDMPCCDGINTWFISKWAKQQGLKAVLSGIGADELCGGYPSFSRIGIAAQLQMLPDYLLNTTKKNNQKKLNRLSYLAMDGIKGRYLFLRGHFTVHEIARQLNMPEKQVWDILNDTAMLPDISSLGLKNQASWMELNLYMQNQLLRDADTMGMAHGIEIRVPFLDNDFIQLMLSIDASVKYGGTLPKALLINTFKKYLPQPVWNRPKMGFSFPFKNWLANSPYVQQTMLQGNEVTRHNYKKFKKEKLHWSHLMSLLILKNAGHA